MAIALGVSCGVVIQTLASLVGGWPVFDGAFMGPDPYMRLNRVLDCRGGGGCPGGLLAWSNAPYGEVLHWPYLQDWLLLAMAAPLRFFLDEGRAVETAAYLLGPALQVGAVATILAATRSLVPGRAWMWSGVFLATQLWVVLAFAPSRPDHHGLQAVFFLLAVAGAIRLLTRGPSGSWEVLTGIGVGGGLWVSVEGLVTVTVALLALGVRWIVGGEEAWLRVNARVTSWCTLVLGLAVVLDGPQAGLLAVVYDRISVVHLACLGGVSLFWWGMAWGGRGRSAGGRLAWALGSAILLAGVLSLPFPGLLRGPLVDVDPRIVPIWLDHVAEYVTLPESGFRVLVMGIGSLLFALPAAGMAFREGDAGARWSWGLILGSLIWFGALGLVHGTRWAYYVSLLAPIPFAWLAGRVFAWAQAVPWTFGKAAVEVGTVAVLALGIPLGVALSGIDDPPPDSAGALAEACPERELARVLEAVRPSLPGSTMLAPLWWGPEIAYRTEFEIIATPYHRNHEGILASRDIMLAPGDEAALAGLRERRVEYILVCRGQGWSPVLTEAPAGSLFERLQHSDAPPFLQPVALPEDLAGRYGLWRMAEAERGAP